MIIPWWWSVNKFDILLAYIREVVNPFVSGLIFCRKIKPNVIYKWQGWSLGLVYSTKNGAMFLQQTETLKFLWFFKIAMITGLLYTGTCRLIG